MSSCSLCRVPATEEHLASGWHKCNVRLNSEGKMPLLEINYLTYEKPREDAAAGIITAPPVAGAHLEKNKHNVNAWHWEEADHTEWAEERIRELLVDLAVPITADDGAEHSITVTSLSEFTGDALTHVRKGKFKAGYELSFSLEWKADFGDFSETGSCVMPDVSIGTEDQEYDVERIKLAGDGPVRAAALAAFKAHAIPALRNALKVFDAEMRAKAAPPTDE